MRRIAKRETNNYRIIVLDDEVGILDTIDVLLSRNGYQVSCYKDPYKVLEVLKNEHFDLLIVDIIMDGMHGDEVVSRIREFNLDIFIIVLTGYEESETPINTIRNLEINGYCEKGENFNQLELMVEAGIKSINHICKLKKFQDGLKKILESVPNIYQLGSIESILSKIIEELTIFTECNNCFIFVDNTVNKSKSVDSIIFRGSGKYNKNQYVSRNNLDYEILEVIGKARINQKTTLINSNLIIPLLDDNKSTLGVVCIEDINLDRVNLKLIETFTKHATNSINNSIVHSIMNDENQDLNQTYMDLQKKYLDTIEALRITVDAKDFNTRGHSDRVSFFAVEIGKEYGLSEKELEILKLGGLFHDIGKIGTIDDIWVKTGKLSQEEVDEVRKHSSRGASILSAVSIFKNVVPLVMYHHERIDGKGYPYGLKGDEIPFLAKIIAVADAFDAMMSDRTYRVKLDFEETKIQLIKGSGKQFDDEIIKVFLRIADKIKDESVDFDYKYEYSMIRS